DEGPPLFRDDLSPASTSPPRTVESISRDKAPGDGRRPSPGRFLYLFTRLDPQVVCHREDSGHAIRPHVDQLFVGLVRNDALKRHVPALDDDVDRRYRPVGVSLERRFAVNSAELSAPN